MGYDESAFARFGMGVLDLQIGDWIGCDDVVTHTNVRHPEQDDKYQARELLRLLGKRFATSEAILMWNEIERYREEMVSTFAPPGKAQGRPSFEQVAREWYEIYGRAFEKSWVLHAPLDVHYARTGREWVAGRWLRIIHPDLVYFVEGGFSHWQIFSALNKPRWGGLYRILMRLRKGTDIVLTRFWVELAAYMLGFELDEEKVQTALAEVKRHAERLGRRQDSPVPVASAAVDYFRRLQLGGLGPEVIVG